MQCLSRLRLPTGVDEITESEQDEYDSEEGEVAVNSSFIH